MFRPSQFANQPWVLGFVALAAHFWFATALAGFAGELFVPFVLPWAIQVQAFPHEWLAVDLAIVRFLGFLGRYFSIIFLVALAASPVYPFVVAKLGVRFPKEVCLWCNALLAVNCVFALLAVASYSRALWSVA